MPQGEFIPPASYSANFATLGKGLSERLKRLALLPDEARAAGIETAAAAYDGTVVGNGKAVQLTILHALKLAGHEVFDEIVLRIVARYAKLGASIVEKLLHIEHDVFSVALMMVWSQLNML